MSGLFIIHRKSNRFAIELHLYRYIPIFCDNHAHYGLYDREKKSGIIVRLQIRISCILQWL